MIVSIYEKNRLNRLNNKGIVIETIYKSDSESKREYVRATDGKVNDSVLGKLIYQKRFFKGEECIDVIEDFGHKVRYTIKSYNDENEIICCPNCNHKGRVIDFIDNCPYCGTNFNIGINNQSYGRRYLYSPSREDVSSTQIVIEYIVVFSVLICMLSPLLGMIATMFTEEIYPMIWGLALLPIGLIVTLIFVNILKYMYAKKGEYIGNVVKKEKNIFKNYGKKQDTFYNDLYTELMLLYYNDKNNIDDADLIDFDILDYKNLTEEEKGKLSIKLKIRKIYYSEDKIHTQLNNYKVTMKQNENITKKEDNFLVINCPSCGSSIDVTDKECKYCGRINNSKNDWILEKIERVESLE